MSASSRRESAENGRAQAGGAAVAERGERRGPQVLDRHLRGDGARRDALRVGEQPEQHVPRCHLL